MSTAQPRVLFDSARAFADGLADRLKVGAPASDGPTPLQAEAESA